MIPNPGNPMDWDRYAYVRNNPVNFNDPTGHDADCGIGERCRLSTVNEFSRAIKQTYKINIKKSALFNLRELKTIYNALSTMEAGIYGLTNGSGLSWIIDKFSDTSITRTPDTVIEKGIFKGAAHVAGSTIYLPENFSNARYKGIEGSPSTMIIHEFGHVLDNRSKKGPIDATIFGGGAGDQLMNYINGESSGFLGVRFGGGITYGSNPFYGLDAQWPTGGNASYGNTSTAEYFAETFAGTVISSNGVPQPSGMWMAAYIDLTK